MLDFLLINKKILHFWSIIFSFPTAKSKILKFTKEIFDGYVSNLANRQSKIQYAYGGPSKRLCVREVSQIL